MRKQPHTKIEQKTAIYVRVSTPKQNPGSQRNDLLQFVDAKGWASPTVYEEHDTGFNNNDRKVLQKMVSDAKVGKFQRIVVWDLSRLSRSGVIDTLQTIDYFQKLGIEIFSKSEGLDFSGQMGLVMAALFSAVANIDYEMRREKQALGIQHAKDKNGGKCWWGGSKRKVDHSKDEAVYRLRKGGHTYRQICKDLGLSMGKVNNIIQQLILDGRLSAGRARYSP